MPQSPLSGQPNDRLGRRIEAVRDDSGLVTGVLVAEPHHPERIYSIQALRLRVNGLRNIAFRYGGQLLLAEGNIEAWSIGILASRITISIPNLEALQMLREPRAAGDFMLILEESERRLFKWLSDLPDFAGESDGQSTGQTSPEG